MKAKDKVLETVIDEISFEFVKDILVKPLEPVMIEKTIIEQVPLHKKDKDGNNLYDTKATKKEVESDFEKGIVLCLPTSSDVSNLNIAVGDTVVYPKKFAKEFDLYRTSKLVKPYDVVAKVAK